MTESSLQPGPPIDPETPAAEPDAQPATGRKRRRLVVVAVATLTVVGLLLINAVLVGDQSGLASGPG